MGLGSWLGGIGGLIAAPFTGGATLGPALGMLGGAAASASAGRAQGRVGQQEADIARQQAILAGLNTDLAQRRFTSSEYQRNAGNAARGSFLEGVKDFNVTPPPGVNMGTISGGARPSAIVDKEGLGGLIRRQSVAQLVTPQALPGVPALPAQPQAGKLDKFLNIFGTIAPMIGALSQSGQHQQQGGGASGGGDLFGQIGGPSGGFGGASYLPPPSTYQTPRGFGGVRF